MKIGPQFLEVGNRQATKALVKSQAIQDYVSILLKHNR